MILCVFSFSLFFLYWINGHHLHTFCIAVNRPNNAWFSPSHEMKLLNLALALSTEFCSKQLRSHGWWGAARSLLEQVQLPTSISKELHQPPPTAWRAVSSLCSEPGSRSCQLKPPSSHVGGAELISAQPLWHSWICRLLVKSPIRCLFSIWIALSCSFRACMKTLRTQRTFDHTVSLLFPYEKFPFWEGGVRTACETLNIFSGFSCSFCTGSWHQARLSCSLTAAVLWADVWREGRRCPLGWWHSHSGCSARSAALLVALCFLLPRGWFLGLSDTCCVPSSPLLRPAVSGSWKPCSASATGPHWHVAPSGSRAVPCRTAQRDLPGGRSLRCALRAERPFSFTREEFEALCPCRVPEVREAYLCHSDRQRPLPQLPEK